MKKILSVLVLTSVGYCAFSQSAGNTSDWASAHRLAGKQNKHTATISSKGISTKALNNFKRTFDNVSNEKWYDMGNGYRADFTRNDIHFRVDYDKNGNWLHTIKRYDEKKLPTEVRRLVVSHYLDHSIRLVEEIDVPNNPSFYIIHLEGKTNWMNIKVCDDEIHEWQKISKS
jgi:hypothetical protein